MDKYIYEKTTAFPEQMLHSEPSQRAFEQFADPREGVRPWQVPGEENVLSKWS